MRATINSGLFWSSPSEEGGARACAACPGHGARNADSRARASQVPPAAGGVWAGRDRSPPAAPEDTRARGAGSTEVRPARGPVLRVPRPRGRGTATGNSHTIIYRITLQYIITLHELQNYTRSYRITGDDPNSANLRFFGSEQSEPKKT